VLPVPPCPRRRAEARAQGQKGWELLSACVAKFDAIAGPLDRAADALALEHRARASAMGRLAGPDNAKAVWIGILGREVVGVGRQAEAEAAARDSDAAAHADGLRQLESQVDQARSRVAEAEAALRRLNAEVGDAAAATQKADRRSRNLEKGAAAKRTGAALDRATGGGSAAASPSAGGAGAGATGAGAASGSVGASRVAGGGAAAGGASSATVATKAPRSAGAAGRPADKSELLDRYVGGTRAAAEAQRKGEGEGSVPPSGKAGVAQPAAHQKQKPPSSSVTSADKQDGAAPAGAEPSTSGLSELQRYQLLLKKWKHRLDQVEPAEDK